MTTTKLDLTGLKCPLPALKTRKALKSVKPGERLEVHCTDPLSVIDIPNLIRETGDKVEITERAESPHRVPDREGGRRRRMRQFILNLYRPIAKPNRCAFPIAS